jgi:voltage-gated potassium channel Kch
MSSADVVKLCHALHVYVAVTLCHAPLPSHCRQGHCVLVGAGLLCGLQSSSSMVVAIDKAGHTASLFERLQSFNPNLEHCSLSFSQLINAASRHTSC